MYVQTIYFWIGFAVLYIVATLYFTSHMYYMGVISLDCGIFARISHFFRYLLYFVVFRPSSGFRRTKNIENVF